jgi:hypothetical protein
MEPEMNGTLHTDDMLSADEGGIDPREAAALIAQTRRQAERQLDLRPPLLTLVQAAAVLIAFGAIWVGVRHQHPYTGPTPVSLLVLYGVIGAAVIAVAKVRQRAHAGLSGASIRKQRIEMSGLAVAYVFAYTVMGALEAHHVSHAITSGIYPATVPVSIASLYYGGISLAKEDWHAAVTAFAIAAVGAGSAFAGPRGVWLSMGIGLAIVCVLSAAFNAWLRRA